MWQEKNAAAERKQNMRYRRYSASSLTDSLRSVVRLRRAVSAYRRGGDFLEDANHGSLAAANRGVAEYELSE
ncbi:hypothetical protein KUT27_004601 [Escherichia coli]|nr:hypothetical protein [Escherichia coli]